MVFSEYEFFFFLMCDSIIVSDCAWLQLRHRSISNEHIYTLQNPPLELSKYQTLPGKRTRKSELRPELNGEGGGEYLSPVQLSPLHSREQDYSLSESTVQRLLVPWLQPTL